MSRELSALGIKSYERKYFSNQSFSDSQSNLTEEPLWLENLTNEFTVGKLLRRIVISLLYTWTALATVLRGLSVDLIALSSSTVNLIKEIISLSPLGLV